MSDNQKPDNQKTKQNLGKQKKIATYLSMAGGAAIGSSLLNLNVPAIIIGGGLMAAGRALAVDHDEKAREFNSRQRPS